MRVTLAPPVNIKFIRLGLLDNFVSGSSYYKELVIYLTLNEISSVCLEIHKLITSIWKKEKLSEEWKELIIVPIHKKGDKTGCNNYRGISLLPTTYKILSNILLSRLIPYAKEIIGDHKCGFRRNRSTIDHIYCIRQILKKNGNTVKKFISSL
jgi:hypothetical protein